LEAAGFKLVGSVEQNPDCRATLRLNRPRWPQLDPGDIFAHTPADILNTFGVAPRELTLVAGGPPCQPFSKSALWVSGESPGMSDPRAKTLDAYMAVVEAALPQAMLLENVKGIGFVGRGRKVAEQALSVLDARLDEINERHDTNYVPRILHLDAADYGVPQHRERLFVFASREAHELEPPAPTHGPKAAGTSTTAYRTCWDAIGDLDFPSEDADLAPRGRWAELLPSVPEGHNYLWHTPRGGGEPLFGWRTKFWSFMLKLARDQPAWTLQAQPGPATGPFHWQDRCLSLREMARLQTFPDDWQITGDYAAGRRQMGNAVPAALGELLGLEIRRAVQGAQVRRALRLIPEARDACPAPIEPAAVPSRYDELRGEHQDHPGAGLGPAAAKRKALADAAKRDAQAVRAEAAGAKDSQAKVNDDEEPDGARITRGTEPAIAVADDVPIAA